MRNRAFALSGGIVVIIVAVAAWISVSGGIQVTVRNSSTKELSSLQIKYSDGVSSEAKLEPNGVWRCKINPRGESHLVLDFVDSSGDRHSTTLDVYFERNYRGFIEIDITPSNKVEFKQKVRTWFD